MPLVLPTGDYWQIILVPSVLCGFDPEFFSLFNMSEFDEYIWA